MKINPKATRENFGGKGYNLHLLKKFCNVPEYFVVLFHDVKEIDDIAVQSQIIAFYNKRKFGLVSVRSSATIEDGIENSFAGMFESKLNVDRDNLVDAIKQVLNSGKSERVKQYCQKKNIDFETIKMRIVIQKMVQSDISGVCFTDNMTIETVQGLGDKLVSGEVLPQDLLSDKQKVELANTAKKIEKRLRFKSADIEFAFENEKLYVLQARAVTTSMNTLPNMNDYELTFEVGGLGLLFADMLCESFEYMNPLFTISNGNFKQYFRNDKMAWAKTYKFNFKEYEKEFTDFYLKNIKILKTTSDIKEFIKIANKIHWYYSYMNTHFEMNSYENISRFKDVARVWINEILVNEDCYMNKLLKKLSHNDLGNYKISELGTKVDIKEIKRRENAVVYFDGHQIKYIIGDIASDLIESAEIVPKDDELCGQVANTANRTKMNGSVRIINVDYGDFDAVNEEINKTQSGEILVAKFTAPELVNACAKASAIITDLGGILSHASIVARELNIPCVVGTKYASKILRTGDKVEINLITGRITQI